MINRTVPDKTEIFAFFILSFANDILFPFKHSGPSSTLLYFDKNSSTVNHLPSYLHFKLPISNCGINYFDLNSEILRQQQSGHVLKTDFFP